MVVTVVTSFSGEGFDLYGRNFVESFKKHWPEDVRLIAYYHDMILPEDVPTALNIAYMSLHEVEDHEEWYKTFGEVKGVLPDGSYNYRMDAVKFSHKVFAFCDAANYVHDGEWLVWLDADTITTEDISMEWLQKEVLSGGDVAWLDRTVINYAETSLVAVNIGLATCKLLGDYRGTFLSGEFLNYTEWHDGFVFTRLMKYHMAHGLKARNLSEGCPDLEAFTFSELGKKMVHLKGPRKYQGVGPQRYGMLAEIVRHYRPKVILETGTWRGDRAQQMAYQSLQVHDAVHYIGFDLFEGASNDTDLKEFNSKQHTDLQDVVAALEAFAAEAEKHGKTFTFELHKGDTNTTMEGIDLGSVEFAFLDGGHSKDTVINDYNAVSHVPVVVFDDYFTVDEGGGLPDEEHCGTNWFIDNVLEEGVRHYVLPSIDPVKGGGLTHLAVVLNDPEAWEPPVFKMQDPEESRGEVRIQPKDSRPKEYLADNITHARQKIDKWLEKCVPHGRRALLCSAGPSLRRHLAEIKKAQKAGDVVVCVKHSLPTLVGYGIKPDYCVILDPRPFEEESTHGKVRSALVDRAPKSTRFLVASMTDKDMVDFLVEKHDVLGWHAWNSAITLVEGLDEEDTFFVQGGTCSAMRAFGVMHTLGFRNVKMYGYDCAGEEKPEDPDERDSAGRPKWFILEIGDKKFYTTGELVAQAQDIEQLFQKVDDMYIECAEGGVAYEQWKALLKDRFKEYKTYPL